MKTIYEKGHTYHLYDSFSSYEKAKKVADMYKKKLNSRYKIIITEEGYWFPKKKIKLYLEKVIRLFG